MSLTELRSSSWPSQCLPPELISVSLCTYHRIISHGFKFKTRGKKQNIGSLEEALSSHVWNSVSFPQNKSSQSSSGLSSQGFYFESEQKCFGRMPLVIWWEFIQRSERTIVFISAQIHKNYFNTMWFGFQVSMMQITVVYLHIWPVSVLNFYPV